MSHEEKLRSVANDVKEARQEVTAAILKLRKEGQKTALYELEMAQKALFKAEATFSNKGDA